MSDEFKKLIELEQKKIITIGLNRNHANNFWSNQSPIGKLLNWITFLFIIATIFIFIYSSFWFGFGSLIITGIYVIIIQKIAGFYTRVKLLKNEDLFNASYESKSTTIRNNNNREIIQYPTDWRLKINQY